MCVCGGDEGWLPGALFFHPELLEEKVLVSGCRGEQCHSPEREGGCVPSPPGNALLWVELLVLQQPAGSWWLLLLLFLGWFGA